MSRPVNIGPCRYSSSAYATKTDQGNQHEMRLIIESDRHSFAIGQVLFQSLQAGGVKRTHEMQCNRGTWPVVAQRPGAAEVGRFLGAEIRRT